MCRKFIIRAAMKRTIIIAAKGPSNSLHRSANAKAFLCYSSIRAFLGRPQKTSMQLRRCGDALLDDAPATGAQCWDLRSHASLHVQCKSKQPTKPNQNQPNRTIALYFDLPFTEETSGNSADIVLDGCHAVVRGVRVPMTSPHRQH